MAGFKLNLDLTQWARTLSISERFLAKNLNVNHAALPSAIPTGALRSSQQKKGGGHQSNGGRLFLRRTTYSALS